MGETWADGLERKGNWTGGYETRAGGGEKGTAHHLRWLAAEVWCEDGAEGR
jgi:hypothetical protein